MGEEGVKYGWDTGGDGWRKIEIWVRHECTHVLPISQSWGKGEV